MKKALIILAVLTLAASAWGQLADQAEVQEIKSTNSFGIKPAPTPFSLIDLSRVRWSHSYSVAFFSGGDYSGSMGLLNSTMFYEISSKLSLALNLGIAHNTGAIWGDGSSDATLLPGFRLDYHPSDKFQMSIGLQRYTGFYTPYPYRYWDYYPLGH